MEFIEGQGEAGERYKEKIIGKTAMKRAPGEYWEIEIAFHKRYTLAGWRAEDAHNRAKIMAQHYLKGMIEFVDAHYKEQDDALKDVGKGKKT